MTRAWERTVGWGACLAAVALLALALLMGSAVEASSGLLVHGATVRLPTVPGRPAAGYLTISGGDATLVSVASPLAARIEMHSNSMAGGVMRMDKLPAAMVRSDTPLVFAPGGSHLMIYGLRSDLKPGATIPLVMTFADGRTLRTDARAIAPGAAMTGHDGH